METIYSDLKQLGGQTDLPSSPRMRHWNVYQTPRPTWPIACVSQHLNSPRFVR